jgi:hypothetical protein
MGLTKQTESNIVFLEVKYYSLWRSLKKHVDGCDIEYPTNPTTGVKVEKFGYRFRSVSGHVVKLVKYDTEHKYSKRYFGFKLTIIDGPDMFVLDMPYASQILRRFLRIARNLDWSVPVSLTIFKGKKKEAGSEDTGIWFQQRGETVKPYYTKEVPHGMPEATQDPDTHEWDFKAQHRWLVERLQSETMGDIEEAAKKLAPPVEQHSDAAEEPEPERIDNGLVGGLMRDPMEVDLDDVPFRWPRPIAAGSKNENDNFDERMNPW